MSFKIYEKYKSLFFAVFLLLFFNVSYGGTLNSVSPMFLEFAKSDKIKTVTIYNKSDREQAYQLITKRWHRDEKNKDLYTTTSDLVISPPIFRTLPKQKQIIRVAVKQANDTDVEKAYRMYIRQIPIKDNKKKLQEENANSVQMQLKLMVSWGLPILVKPAKIINNILWNTKLLSQNQVQLDLVNAGNVSLVVSNLKLFASSGKQLTMKKQDVKVMRVFPGEKFSWVFILPEKQKNSQKLLIEAKIGEHRNIKKILILAR